MIYSFIPIFIVNLLGSIAMVVIALLALDKAKMLRATDPDNMVFLYLEWICIGFNILAVLRSSGLILNQLLIFTYNIEIWDTIRSYSCTANTVPLMLVGLITLFFKQCWTINEKILSARQNLEEAHIELVSLNHTLEQKVIERTEMMTSSEYKVRRIFELSLDTIILTDEQFKIIEINPAGVNLTGYKKELMMQNKMNLENFMARPSVWDRIRKKLENHENILNEEIYFLRPDQSKISALITAGVDYSPFGCNRTFHFIIKNINEKKQMMQQIAQADKLAALGELSAGMAHEINNPLSIILGYTQLMLKTDTDSEHSEDLQIIEKHVKNCKSVVSDLLSFSRKGSTKRSLIDVKKPIDEAIKFLSRHTDFRKVEIHLELEQEEQLMIYGNEQELTQVLINLMINACHAVDKNGRIELKSGKEDIERIVIEIKDNGTGIKKKYLSRIFDPFFTTKPTGKGTGLGLSVGYGIIHRHGGKITARNRKEKGAVFTISLPEDQAL